MNNNPIGVFDSGVGGLSVFSQLIRLMPNENYIYYGDTINLPYGDKSKEELVEITGKIFDFFKSRGVKAVVMACNTTSATTYDILKTKYSFKIYPIVQTVAKEIALKNYNRIGVFATNATINSHAYKREVRKYNLRTEVFETACPKWVSIVENQLQNDPESINDIKTQLDLMLTNKPDKIILGCTHYPYLINVLSHYAGTDLFINPAKSFAENIYKDLKEQELISDNQNNKIEFLVSSNPDQFISASKLFYDVREAKEIDLSRLTVNYNL